MNTDTYTSNPAGQQSGETRILTLAAIKKDGPKNAAVKLAMDRDEPLEMYMLSSLTPAQALVLLTEVIIEEAKREHWINIINLEETNAKYADRPPRSVVGLRKPHQYCGYFSYWLALCQEVYQDAKDQELVCMLDLLKELRACSEPGVSPAKGECHSVVIELHKHCLMRISEDPILQKQNFLRYIQEIWVDASGLGKPGKRTIIENTFEHMFKEWKPSTALSLNEHLNEFAKSCDTRMLGVVEFIKEYILRCLSYKGHVVYSHTDGFRAALPLFLINILAPIVRFICPPTSPSFSFDKRERGIPDNLSVIAGAQAQALKVLEESFAFANDIQTLCYALSQKQGYTLTYGQFKSVEYDPNIAPAEQTLLVKFTGYVGHADFSEEESNGPVHQRILNDFKRATLEIVKFMRKQNSSIQKVRFEISCDFQGLFAALRTEFRHRASCRSENPPPIIDFCDYSMQTDTWSNSPSLRQ